MNQTLLFLIGTAVFAVTLVGVLLYGYAMFDRSYQADVDAQLYSPVPLTGIEVRPLTTDGPAVAAPVVG